MAYFGKRRERIVGPPQSGEHPDHAPKDLPRRTATVPTSEHDLGGRMSPANAAAPRRVLYVVTEDYAFLLNRLPMARAARAAGYEVHVATNVNKGAEAIEREGFILH